jgi:hypothetical protein
VIPVLVIVVGLALLVAGWLVLRSFGPRLRVGRLLASTPRVSVADAVALARRGARRYVRIDGRIDSEAEFEDAQHRPLVLRRTRLQARRGAGWQTVDDEREQVPFTINEGLAAIAVDAAALDQGLVVVPRESLGTAGDVRDRAAGLPPETPVRVRIEQLSSVEHAIALGVPVADADGARLTAGLGRPLVLTTLDPTEAMRVIAEGRTAAPRAAAVLLAAGALVALAGIGWLLVEAVT